MLPHSYQSETQTMVGFETESEIDRAVVGDGEEKQKQKNGAVLRRVGIVLVVVGLVAALSVKSRNARGSLKLAPQKKMISLWGDMAVSLNDSDRTALLNRHNKFRDMTAQGKTPNQPGARSMEKVLWDPVLEQLAMADVGKCEWAHNNNLINEYARSANKPMLYSNEHIGQMRYFSYGGSSSGVSINDLLGFLDGWFGEHVNYFYGNDSCVGGNCGLYTQLVWGSTRYIGCGYKKCAVLTDPQTQHTWNNAVNFVCYYLVGATYGRPYVSVNSSHGVCSECPSDRRTCDGGLCSGCPSYAYYKCNTDYWTNCGDLTWDCPNCPTQSSPSQICSNCPKTCKYCAGVPISQTVSAPSCPPLDPASGLNISTTTSAPTAATTARPTRAPVNTTSSCTGIIAHFSFQFGAPNATCPEYSLALTQYEPCIPRVVSCVISSRTDMWQYVTLGFETSLDVYNAAILSEWYNGMRVKLVAMGVHFVF